MAEQTDKTPDSYLSPRGRGRRPQSNTNDVNTPGCDSPPQKSNPFLTPAPLAPMNTLDLDQMSSTSTSIPSTKATTADNFSGRQGRGLSIAHAQQEYPYVNMSYYTLRPALPPSVVIPDHIIDLVKAISPEFKEEQRTSVSEQENKILENSPVHGHTPSAPRSPLSVPIKSPRRRPHVRAKKNLEPLPPIPEVNSGSNSSTECATEPVSAKENTNDKYNTESTPNPESEYWNNLKVKEILLTLLNHPTRTPVSVSVQKGIGEKSNGENISENVCVGDHSETDHLEIIAPKPPIPKPRKKFSEKMNLDQATNDSRSPRPNPLCTVHNEEKMTAASAPPQLERILPQLDIPVVQTQGTQTGFDTLEVKDKKTQTGFDTPELKGKETQTGFDILEGKSQETQTGYDIPEAKCQESQTETSSSEREDEEEDPRNCSECKLRIELKEVKELMLNLSETFSSIEDKLGV